MPSGPKKRKQAKKKKEQQAHSNTFNSSSVSDTHSEGNDDPRSQDERDSDGGEVGSPASLGHQNQTHPFNEESEILVQSSFVTEESAVGVEGNVEGNQTTSVENESAVEIQREVSLGKDIESVDVNVEQVEFSKAPHNGDDKSSSSSSSDEESQAFDGKQKVESHYSAPDAISFVDAVKVEEVKEDSTIEKPVTKDNGISAMGWVPPPVMPMSEVAKHGTEGAQFDNVEVIDVVESEFKENEDYSLPKSDVVAGAVPEVNEEKVLPILNQNAEASNVVSASSVNGNEDKSPKSSSSQTAYALNNRDSEASSVAHSETDKNKAKARDFEASDEASENIETKVLPLPDVPPAPQILQRTSFLSCCGLFDVLTGSNR